MLIIPSVDILKGKCVRLTRGQPSSEEVFFQDPLKAALHWENQGAEALHIVDLDGALGQGDNMRHIRRILKEVSIDVEVGGGIRSLEKAIKIYSMGAERVILGSFAFRDPKAVKKLAGEIGGNHVMVALDYKGEMIMVEGWTKTVNANVYDVAAGFEEAGARWILATAVTRDGTLKGADVRVISELVRKVKVMVVASGGVKSLEDVIALKNAGAAGVVIGKALYKGLLSLREAKEAARCWQRGSYPALT
ncbi:MAG: 1-(5-phosphoribosyl)-5-[(5-phosphoribosylamino)methylideneamino]imidazole-4-carboxamide isomerase [Candidatus Freyarchaeota archaeon]